jgi:hypothetical protein
MSKREAPEEETKLSSEELNEIVKTIYEYKASPKDKMRIFRRQYPTFAESYPTLFEMSCQPHFNMNQFRQMLFMLNKVQTQELSQDEASAVVGQSLFNTFVKPKLDMSKEPDYDSQFQKKANEKTSESTSK